MNQVVIQSLTGVGFPTLAVLVASALGFAVCREHPRIRAMLLGLFIAGGIVWAYRLAFGGFAYPPREPGHWLPYLAAVAALVGCVRLWIWRHFWSFVLSIGTAVIFFWSQLSGNALVYLWIAGLTLLLAASAALLQIIEDRCSGAELSLGLALAAGLGGVALFLGGSAVIGQISGAFGLMLGGVAVLAFFWNATVGPIIPFIYVFVFGSLLLVGCLFAELPWISAILLWLAPWPLLFGQRSERPHWPSRAGALVLRMLGVVILVGLALGSVFLLVPPSSDF